MAKDPWKFPGTIKKPSVIFVCSMSDFFVDDISNEMRAKAIAVMRDSPHFYLVLTKRADRMYEFFQNDVVPPNIGLGVTVESEQYTWRLRLLAEIQAFLKFASFEPLLGSVSFDMGQIDWAIVGGESKHGARIMQPDFVETIRERCILHQIPFLFKQWGGYDENGNRVPLKDQTSNDLIGGKQYKEFPEILQPYLETDWIKKQSDCTSSA